MSSDSSILHPLVRETLETRGVHFETLPCDPDFADTAEFCARYGIPPEDTCNTIVVVLKTTPRSYVACVVLADSRLDVNHRVSKLTGARRLSFASTSETTELTGMLTGGVTAAGLPEGIPILIDHRVMTRSRIVLGGGNRSSKISLEPRELLKLPMARIEEIALER